MENRVIKFRAWRNGEMHEGVQPLFDSETPTKVMVPDMGIVFIEPTGDKRYWYEIPVEAIMQSTGLKDKNGVEIYEGDIVKWHSTHKGAVASEHTDKIEWQSPFACFMLMPHVHEPHAAVMEVIGNIYTHPHLLNQTNHDNRNS